MNKNYVIWDGTKMDLVGSEVEVGQKAKDFKLIANDMSVKTLADYEGKVKVISVVPSLDTPVCNAATRWFNQNVTSLGEDIVVLTVSMDLPFAQERWCGAGGIKSVVTLSDFITADFSKDYGVLIKDLRLTGRAIIVLDKDNVIRYKEYVEDVSNQVNFDAVVEAVKEIK